MKAIKLVIAIFFVANLAFAQQPRTGINTNTPDPSAALHVVSPNHNQGVLFPRLTDPQRQAIASPATGLLIYNVTTNSFWYYDGTSWADLSAVSVPEKIQDSNGDTSVEAINLNGGSDKIEFKLDGIKKWEMVDESLWSNLNSSNLFIGSLSGLNNTGNQNTFVGVSTGASGNSGGSNSFFGQFAGNANTSGARNTFIGRASGRGSQTGNDNVFLGNSAGVSINSGNYNVFLGANAASNLSQGSNNIVIGHGVGPFGNNSSNKLIIEGGYTSGIFPSPLIYGEFDNDYLQINGQLGISNAYKFPTTDGIANQVLQTDGNGLLTWGTPSNGSNSNKIQDNTDMDTSIEAIEGVSGATDKIELKVNGTTQWNFIEDRLEEANNSGNILIGKSTGAALTTGFSNTVVGSMAGISIDKGNQNSLFGHLAGRNIDEGAQNILIGSSSGLELKSGTQNVLIGVSAGASQVTTGKNTMLGTFSGLNNQGTGNVFIGFNAGANESGSNKLIIENADTNTDGALIYGEFNNDILRINGELQLGVGGAANRYRFPTSRGAAGDILQLDNAGQLNWTTVSGGAADKIQDAADMDTEVIALEGANGASDEIDFKTDGTTYWKIRNKALESWNNFGTTVIGFEAGQNMMTGADRSVFLGNFAGKSIQTGIGNVFVGAESGRSQTQDGANTFLGFGTGFNHQSGGSNTFVGYEAGKNNLSGTLNVFLGNVAGYNETGSNKLYIENSAADADNALVYGEFDNQIFRVNGQVQLGMGGTNSRYTFPVVRGNTGETLQLDANGNLNWASTTGGTSDKIVDIVNGDTKVEALDLVTGDEVRVTVQGNQEWRFFNNRLEQINAPNLFIGAAAGSSNTVNGLNGVNNVFLGNGAGQSNSSGRFNTFTGSNAGNGTQNGEHNSFYGSAAGAGNTSGTFNTAIGSLAGTVIQAGDYNTYLGASAGDSHASGGNNTFVGYAAGSDLQSGVNNTFIGTATGSNSMSGSENIFIGYLAGKNETGSGRLHIESSGATTPLIWGDFNSRQVGINRVAIDHALEVNGNASKNTPGPFTSHSDERLKKNIQKLSSEEILQKMLALQGVTYEWKDDKTNTQRPEGLQYGFTAQNIQTVFPELVKEDHLGYLQTAYSTYDAMYVESIRALFHRIQQLETENQILKQHTSEIAQLKAEISAMRGMVKH